MSNAILQKSAIGSAYSIAVSAITLILGFTRVILLTRLLGVEVFGVITLALFFSRLVMSFSSLGLDHALLQKKEPSPLAYSTHYMLRIGFSIAAGLLCIAISPILRIGYDDQLVNVFLILLMVNLLDSTYATHFVILRRDMRFGTLAIINLCASVLMTIITPLAAYIGAGVWSLVIEHVVGSTVRWIGVWIVVRPWKQSFHLNLTEARSQITFGSKVLSGNLLGIVLDRFDDFWIGTSMGATALGYYSRAYELTQYPERILGSPITSVFMSIYASIQDKSQELSKAFFRSSSFLIRASLLISVVMFTTTPELVSLLFTSRWLSIVPVFRLMVIYIILDPLYINLCSLLVGLGYPTLLNKTRMIQAGVFIIGVISMAKIWEINGVAIAANMMMIVGVTLLLFTSRRFVRYSLRRMLLWPLIAAISASLVGIFTLSNVAIASLLLSFLIKLFLVSITYILILIIFEYKDVRRYGFASIKYMVEHLRMQTRI